MPEFKNPNHETLGPGGGGASGGDFRSMLVMLTVVIAIFLTFQYFKPAEPTPATPQPTQQQKIAQPAGASPSTTTANAAAPVSAQGVPAVAAAAETETTVENELYRIVFTNRGAQVKHWILKKYFDTGGKPLDLVQPQLAQQFGLPLSLFTYETDLTSQLNQALYQSSTTGTLLAPASLTFQIGRASGRERV